jgi:hypothetical protein
MTDFTVRCSAISRLMAKPDNADLDPTLVTPEVQAIIAKTKRSDEEKSVLEDVRRKSLSTGGKTLVRELLREAVYDFEPADIETRPILKGRAVEEAECLPMLCRLTGRPLVKNRERRSNGFISGECDIFDAPLRHGRDIKAPYSMQTMPVVLDDCYSADYEWQMQGYMILWDGQSWSVDYLLVSTPEELIGFEPPALHYVGHIPEHLRWTSWLVERDRALQSRIEDKVSAARRYYRLMLNEFDRTHRLPGEAPAAPAAPAAPVQPVASGRVDLSAPVF